MAREHLYKAKRKDNGEWLEGNLDKIVYEYPNKTVEEYYINETHFGFQDDDGFDPCYQCGFNEPVDENTICEYTGLQDKFGTKIFEHDIVKINDDYGLYGMNAGETYEIYFDYGGFRLKPKYDKIRARGCWVEDGKDFEVIGNKFDNPELLEVQDEQAN